MYLCHIHCWLYYNARQYDFPLEKLCTKVMWIPLTYFTKIDIILLFVETYRLRIHLNQLTL